MNFFQEQPLIVFHAAQPAAIDLAARIGLSTPALAWPAAVADDGEIPAGRPLLLVGRNNRLLPAGHQFSPLDPGNGALTRIGGDAVLLWGADDTGEALACLWAAACWSGDLTEDEHIVTAADMAALPVEAAVQKREAAWPRRGDYGCLSQTFSPEGLLASRDGVFPDDTCVSFTLAPAVTAAEFAAVLELAARLGAESTGLRFPMNRGAGPVVRVGLDEGDGWVRLTADGLSVGAGPNLTKVLTYLARSFPRMPGGQGWLAWDVWAVKDVLSHRGTDQPAIILDKTWEDPGEEHRLREIWRGEILPQLAGDTAGKQDWQLTVTLSEPREIRTRLTAELTNSLSAAGFENFQVTVRPAFKQGYYWLVDEVLPALEKLRPGRVVIGWRPLAEPAVRDLPIRWLQEVYPADEILGGRLGAAVELSQLPHDAPEALEVRAYRGDEQVFAAAMTPASCRRPYLDSDPDEGLACCPAGWIEARHPAKGMVVSRHFPTDLELFWQWYSADVLARIEAMAGPAEPLFGTLAVEYSGSEPEEQLGVRQEIASPLEALHEDIYFTTLDRLASLGKRRRGEAFNAPGAVLPWLKTTPGLPPRARVTLTRPVRRDAAMAAITGIHLDGRVATDSGIIEAPAFGAPAGQPAAAGGPVNMAKLVSRLAALGLAGDGSIRVRVAGRSVGGLPIFALELPARAGTFGAGAALRYPTLLINARHHANEVSSTTAALNLVQDLERFPDLRDKTNIVIIPLENVDGARLHDLMQQDNPQWKLHAARYNQDGCEFYGEYFRDDTPFSEARALSRLWRQWLPDVVLDAHGVPSHEWVQCFSGYSSPPRFKMSFWLPNALIYGILYEPRDQAGNLAAGLDFAHSLTAAFEADGEIHGRNRLWLERYRRFGHDLLPAKFPVELLDDAIFYRQDAAERKTSFTWWRPEVTAVHCVTEVADETAQGEYLGLCARAQVTAMLAAAGWLAGKPVSLSEGAERTATGLVRRWRRRQRVQETAAGEVNK